MTEPKRTLGILALQDHALVLAKEMGFAHARTDTKLNSQGELVVAILIPPRYAGEWEAQPAGREAKRDAEKWRR